MAVHTQGLIYIHTPIRADLMEGSEMIESVCGFQPSWTQQLTAWTDKKRAEAATAETNRQVGSLPMIG